MEFAGDASDMCVISFASVSQLERPVGFDNRHAFEFESIVNWLQHYRGTHPVTGQVIHRQPVSSVLRPLVVNGDASHVSETQRLLLQTGWVIDSEAQPAVSNCVLSMSMPIDDGEQVVVSWRTKLLSNVALGLIGSFVDFLDRLRRSDDIMFSFVKNVISVLLIMVTIYKHYPVNRYLVISYLSALSIFIQFVYEEANATIVQRSDKVVSLFYGAKLLFDFMVWVTGSPLV